MDRFELHWPDVDAQLLTDGWRCRIVWRQRGRRQGQGIGGTIDNNLQCVRRLAESLEDAPYLLGALRSRGHDRLASQIETAAEGEAAPPARVGHNAPQRPPAAPARAPARSPAATWLATLEGSDGFETAANRRAKTWFELGVLRGEALLLKAPAPKGKQEWVLKRTWPEDPSRKAGYVAAAEFKGIAAWLVQAGADEGFIDGLFHATASLDDDALRAAASAWRGMQARATH